MFLLTPTMNKHNFIMWIRFNIVFCNLNLKLKVTLCLLENVESQVHLYDIFDQVIIFLNQGDRIGNAKSSYFNSPSSIVYWRPDTERQKNVTNGKVYIVKDEYCSIKDSQCLLNQTQLTNFQPDLKLQNIRIQPSYDLFSINPASKDEYLFIADKMNHCIKKITISTKICEVVAGFCGKSGFLDGPLGFNRLFKPSNLGIDGRGILYFFDQGNQYMRKLTLQNNVQTLLNGACTQYKLQSNQNRIINDFQLRQMICYQNWIQKKTAGSIQHYFNQDLLNICTLHSSQCKSEL